MKNLKYIITILVVSLIFIGCGPNGAGISPFAKEKKVFGFSFIEAKVIEVFGDKVIVELDDKDIVVGDSYEDKLTNKIIKSSLFIVGMDTHIGKEKAKVTDIRANQVTFTINNSKLKSNSDIKIYIPKKTIAIMDFSLIGVKSSDIKQVALEDMTTKMVQSGQYVVVERTKLDTILKEQKLANSGLLDEASASKVGKLLSADIILTGSFAKKANKWNVNLRLVDVTTGIIVSAINEKIDLDEFRPKQAKDSSNEIEDFKDNVLNKGWNKKVTNIRGAKATNSIDNTTGANNTSSSFKIDYYLSNNKSLTIFPNLRLRDLTQYKGIQFYAKASDEATLSVVTFDQDIDNANKYNKWVKPVDIGTSWRKYQVPFNEMFISKFAILTNGAGDGVFDLDNVNQFNFGIFGRLNKQNQNNTLWLDEISFY